MLTDAAIKFAVSYSEEVGSGDEEVGESKIGFNCTKRQQRNKETNQRKKKTTNKHRMRKRVIILNTNRKRMHSLRLPIAEELLD